MVPSAAAALSQMIRGALVTQLIYVAARLGIADLLQSRPKTPQELAITVGADAPALYRILRALASLGLFAEAGDGRFQTTPLAELLRRDADYSLRGSALLYGEGWWWRVVGSFPRRQDRRHRV
jgi:DNA-binding IclR family transcriptional regulator